MDTLALMGTGFLQALSPLNLLLMAAATAVGVTIGCLPGLSAAMGVALLLPVTFGMDPATGLIILGGIYCGAIFGGSISAISGLSFLGLGIQPPYPEWGAMLSDGRAVMRYYPNLLIAPCIMIALTILSISLFGDGLRDAMDPRLKD